MSELTRRQTEYTIKELDKRRIRKAEGQVQADSFRYEGRYKNSKRLQASRKRGIK